MFLTKLTDAVTTALGASGDTLAAGNLEAVAEFLDFAVRHFGFGVTPSSIVEGTATYTDLGAASLIETYTTTFTVNGFNGSLTFTSADATYPAGAVVNEGSTVAGTPPAKKRWTVSLSVDGADVDTTVDADEGILVATRLV